MNDLLNILNEIELLENSGEAYAMATLVDVAGSAYRGVGARMLVSAAGKTVGTISGGCLEGDVVERARQVIDNGKPLLAKYDTTSDEDIFWGTGMGCGGVIHVFIDCPSLSTNRFKTLKNYLLQGDPAVLATVFRYEGAYADMTGQRLLFNGENLPGSQLQDAALEAAILTDARRVWNSGKSVIQSYKLDQCHADVLIEFIAPPLPLLIFGGGHDVFPLLHFARQLGWRSTVVDHRQAFAARERFPAADEVLLWEDAPKPPALIFNSRTVCVVMTHHYLTDKKILKELLGSPVKYIGLLGPQKRAAQLLAEIRNESENITDPRLERLFSPVGLDIGADNAEEIALSIIAEIQAAINGRDGESLRKRKGAIHERNK